MNETETRRPLITVEEFRTLARPVSLHLDTEAVEQYIRESEDASLIPATEWELYKFLTIEGAERPQALAESFDPKIATDGGEWTETSDRGYQTLRLCNGLKKALAYFTYARLQRADGNILSRAGAMRHRDERADHTDDQKLKQYNDIVDMAERYLSDTLYYIKKNTKEATQKPAQARRASIKAIGD